MSRHHKHEQSSEQWGLCKSCKWWQIEPAAHAGDHTVGVCIEETLQHLRLRIAGNGGCNLFLAGEPAHQSGSSAKPPTTVATR